MNAKLRRSSLQICQEGHPVLRSCARPVNLALITSPEYQELVDKMVVAMRQQLGVGIAAPQVGVGLRVFCLEFTATHLKIMGPEKARMREMSILPLCILANPVLKVTKEEKAIWEEGCLSFAGFVAKVPRARQVFVSGLNREGTEEKYVLNGWSARIAQHEMDHLEGMLYIDRMLPKSLKHIACDQHVGFGKELIEKYERILAIKS